MANTDGNGSWEKIQNGVKETERLIGQRDYNSAMMKARQTLEFMVKQLADRASIIEGGDLKELIDTLYENQWISKSTCEHYHKIRMIGNKAAHEGDASAYNANQAYHMLSQEVYTFANNHSNAQKGSRIKNTNRGAARTPLKSGSSQTGKGAVQSEHGSSHIQGRQSAASSSRSRRHHPQKTFHLTAYDLLKLLIPVLCIILLFFVVKLFGPEKEDTRPTKAQVTAETTSPAADTEATTPAAESSVTYRTTTTLNVRSKPGTDADRIGKLPEGAAVEYVGVYDAEWAIIRYEGQEAYVASQYLKTE